jgi:cell wall-associated protease
LQLLDYEQDSVYGTSVNRAHKELLKGKKSQTVVDDGIDITQEDLQGDIWTNNKEIAGKGTDDKVYSRFRNIVC